MEIVENLFVNTRNSGYLVVLLNMEKLRQEIEKIISLNNDVTDDTHDELVNELNILFQAQLLKPHPIEELIKEAEQRGYGKGFQDGADEIMSRV